MKNKEKFKTGCFYKSESRVIKCIEVVANKLVKIEGYHHSFPIRESHKGQHITIITIATQFSNESHEEFYAIDEITKPTFKVMGNYLAVRNDEIMTCISIKDDSIGFNCDGIESSYCIKDCSEGEVAINSIVNGMESVIEIICYAFHELDKDAIKELSAMEF